MLKSSCVRPYISKQGTCILILMELWETYFTRLLKFFKLKENGSQYSNFGHKLWVINQTDHLQ